MKHSLKLISLDVFVNVILVCAVLLFVTVSCGCQTDA
jgi:hypothetical protein